MNDLRNSLKTLLISLIGLLSACGTPEPTQPVIVVFGGSNAAYPVDLGIAQSIPNALVIRQHKSGSALTCSQYRPECWNGAYTDELIETVSSLTDHVDAYVFIQGRFDSKHYAGRYDESFAAMKDKLEAKFGKGLWAGTKMVPNSNPYAQTIRKFYDKKFDCVEDLKNYETYDETHLIESEDIRLGTNLGVCLKGQL